MVDREYLLKVTYPGFRTAMKRYGLTISDTIDLLMADLERSEDSKKDLALIADDLRSHPLLLELERELMGCATVAAK